MTTTETTTGLMTADELLRLGDDVHGELIRGVFCEMSPPGTEHGEIVMRLGRWLGNFIEPRQLGRLGGDTGIWLERDPDTVRAPDIVFRLAERLPPGPRITGYSEVMPDLAVEVRSPNDTRPDVRAKAEMWLSHGVRLVWVVHPDTRTIDVYRPDAEMLTLGAAATLDGGDVLPGFTCAVSTVFGA